MKKIKKDSCPCGDNKCNKKESSQGLKIEDKPFLSNDEWKLTHKRSYMEMWLDQYNHIMEFSRTILAVITVGLQLIILYRLTH